MWEEFFDGLGKPGVFTAMVPGRLADGSIALLDWIRKKGEQVEFLDVEGAVRN
jgi:hypothetical protein